MITEFHTPFNWCEKEVTVLFYSYDCYGSFSFIIITIIEFCNSKLRPFGYSFPKRNGMNFNVLVNLSILYEIVYHSHGCQEHPSDKQWTKVTLDMTSKILFSS